ncbi:siderophore-interacting protein [Streptomyces sp. NPDC020719]|uniref:siderophore-interacting protein n=1 Tax=unclassified Streptomyces TaxID=2593676 RepID=UPI0033BFF70D
MTLTAETATVPFRLFDLHVVRTRRLGPSLIRITFGGEELAYFEAGGRDQSLSLFLPHPGQRAPVLPPAVNPETWFAEYRALPDDVRAVMRSYTVRAQRREPDEVDIDFALHQDGGPACRWADRAAPGDRVAVLGPAIADNTAVRFRPPVGTDGVVLWGDETALPALSSILEWLPSGTPVRAWITVPFRADRMPLPSAADVAITWLVEEEGAASPVDAVRAETSLPGVNPYVWIAGESSSMRELRRHFVNERQVDRRNVTFVGYWRRGRSEDQLRAEETA